MKKLWTEQYRPETANEYVFRDNSQRQQVETWIAEKSIPHLLFSGGPGTGKTTLAKVITGLLPQTNGNINYNGKTLPSRLEKRTKEQLRKIQIIVPFYFLAALGPHNQLIN